MKGSGNGTRAPIVSSSGEAPTEDEGKPSKSRRDFLKAGSALLVGGTALASENCAPLFLPGKGFSGNPDKHDVIIIGTGFGATVAATELASAFPQADILMLERGVYFTSQDRPVPPYLLGGPNGGQQPYQSWPAPDTDAGFVSSFLPMVRTSLTPTYRALKGQVPLYHYTMFDEVDIVTAGGVGGGSLIYSNVSLEPFFDPATQAHPVMQDWPVQVDQNAYVRARRWMETWRSRANNVVTTVPLSNDLKPYIANLGAVPNSSGPAVDYEYLYLPRSRALRTASKNVTIPAGQGGPVTEIEPWGPLDLQVAEHGGTPAAELKGARFCERQGRCFLGCLPAARQTLNKTLINKLLTTPNSHVKLRPLAHVQQIRASADGYEVIHHDVISGDESRSWAKVVIVAAGVLGTTEILLRSRDMPIDGAGQLVLSDALGSHFSTNGDFSGFVRGIPRDVPDASGKPVDNRVWPTRGPINTSHVTYRAGSLYMNVEDAGIPAMFATIAHRFVNAVQGSKLSFGAFIGQTLDSSLAKLTEPEMVQDLFWFNCMGTDGIPGRPFRDASGQFRFDRHGQLTMTYKNGSGPTHHPVFQQVEDILKAYATQMKGTYVPFPQWSGSFGAKKLVVTHPLGGCPMGRSSTDGVVDSEGRVFNTKAGANTVHQGLYIMDGSMLPGPVAVNPTLTIVALGLRVADSVKSALKPPPTA